MYVRRYVTESQWKDFANIIRQYLYNLKALTNIPLLFETSTIDIFMAFTGRYSNI